MALTNLSTTNQIQSLVGLDAGGLFRLANDGDSQALTKVAGPQGDGGPDVVITANSSGAAETFDIAYTSLLKLYAASISGTTRLVLRAKISSRAAAVANSDYWELYQVIDDIGGTPTVVIAAGAVVAVEGAAHTDPTISISGANVRITVTTAAASAVRIELYVNHIQ